MVDMNFQKYFALSYEYLLLSIFQKLFFKW
nr:MAG TPA: hypothetical protein [Caudoviricetes sp.]